MTSLQRAVLAFVRGYVGGRGRGPSYEEIRRALGLSNRGRVHQLVAGLEARGEVTRVPGHPRSLRPVEPLDRVVDGLLANILERRPEAGWARVREADIAALELALGNRRGRR